ncbi:hypothetical protein TSOC_003578 [Tetrabaena socialis]|uniref:Uncharacterized protein n=1 Tax=Tetrabaena socialis TaxID=47790 RepID=A0A2J8AB69_9CHLO|nr:hypothetical protein TSOC_003578 [Tetrabaena socialis]|eukprot:PNH09769.1 hypothetical protein TSOC_003578 [Tetrabaena socialis]
MAAPKTKVQQGVLLFEEDDDEQEQDPQLEKKINKYLEERSSKNPSRKEITKPPGAAPRAEEHTGITDDEADDEGEPDYDVASRLTLKASSEAFLDVMAEARMQYEQEEASKTKGKAAAGSKPAPKKKA